MMFRIYYEENSQQTIKCIIDAGYLYIVERRMK